MEKIRIITDSGSDILAPYPENLTVIPLTIHFGQEEYRDGPVPTSSIGATIGTHVGPDAVLTAFFEPF